MPTPLRLFALLALVALSATAQARELNCTVSVNASAIEGNEYGFLSELTDDVTRYLNDRSWTSDRFEERERIDCAMQIVFRSAEGLTNFTAEIVVRAGRPVYATAQPTTLLLVNDNTWQFSYTRGQSLVYDPERFDRLVSVLDFYAFLILGYDYDSFSELGGTPYFERARIIADRGATSGAEGWGGSIDAGDDRTRGNLIRDLLDPAFLPLRRAHFDYHFGVLDSFLLGPEEAWEAATEVLQELNELFLQFNQRRYATDVFFTAKYQELTRLLLESPQRNEAYALLAEMDPAHLSEYDKLISGR